MAATILVQLKMGRSMGDRATMPQTHIQYDVANWIYTYMLYGKTLRYEEDPAHCDRSCCADIPPSPATTI